MRCKGWLLGVSILLLVGCSKSDLTVSPSLSEGRQEIETEGETSQAASTESSDTETAATESKGEGTSGNKVQVKGQEYIIDPPYDYQIEDMFPKDFGTYFLGDYKSESQVYTIGIGTEWENEVTHISGKEEGATIYVIAGVHGDEEAAWRTGQLLKTISIQAGNLYILAPANPWGASAQPKTRYVCEEQDLNRSFPGSATGNGAEQVADLIYKDVERVSADFVLDLHEARLVSSGKDFLGSSLIFTDLGDQLEMFLDLIYATQDGSLCSEPFDYLSPGPEGSVNKVITTELSIPTITVETFRGYPMERRIGDQLAIVQYILQQYQMVQ